MILWKTSHSASEGDTTVTALAVAGPETKSASVVFSPDAENLWDAFSGVRLDGRGHAT